MKNTVRTGREPRQTGTAGEMPGLHARCDLPEPTLVSSDEGAKGFCPCCKPPRSPGALPCSRCRALGRQDHSNALHQGEGGRIRGSLGETRGAGKPEESCRRALENPGVTCTSGHAHLQHRTLEDEEGA